MIKKLRNLTELKLSSMEIVMKRRYNLIIQNILASIVAT
jgi:hypothetical protein